MIGRPLGCDASHARESGDGKWWCMLAREHDGPHVCRNGDRWVYWHCGSPYVFENEQHHPHLMWCPECGCLRPVYRKHHERPDWRWKLRQAVGSLLHRMLVAPPSRLVERLTYRWGFDYPHEGPRRKRENWRP